MGSLSEVVRGRKEDLPSSRQGSLRDGLTQMAQESEWQESATPESSILFIP